MFAHGSRSLLAAHRSLLRALSTSNVIDIHCHILPEVDDGAKSWETAVGMCRMAGEDGIDHMVAAPHSNDRYFYDREYLSGLLQNLQQRIGDRPKLSLGCDFHLSLENMQAALVAPEKYSHRRRPVPAGGVQQLRHSGAN